MDAQADVLIVAVTPAEINAILAVFAPVCGVPKPVTIEDRVYHDLGMVNDARIFLGISEMGSGGVGGSQQSVQKAVGALKPNAVLMVGIAFGVNPLEQTIGDILVSQQLSLYELQRKGDEVRLRGDKPHASPRLINFCRNTAFVNPDAPAQKVRVGLLLTGEKLIDNIDYRNQLIELEPEAIGGEMEGGGLYVACSDVKTDWIVIKAICDWADGNKSNPKKKEHQATAAKNAATFALNVLRKASFKTSAQTIEMRSFTPSERMLLLRLYDFQGTCIIRKARGEQEHLRVPGYMGDMQWGSSNNDDRLSWLYVVQELLTLGLLERSNRNEEYRLSARGENEAWKLALTRGKQKD